MKVKSLYIRGQKTAPFRMRMNNGRSVFRFEKPRALARGASLCCILTVFFCATASFCRAQDINEIPPFVKEDRVLVLAPHPDDEAIGTGGILQRAVKAGSSVKVVCLTNGDANELAFIVYEKRLTFRKGEFLYMGDVRSKETVKAMTSLGISSRDIIFLGYPDFGTMEILTKYWGKAKPYKSILTRVRKVSYSEAYSKNAPYVGESILSDLESILLDFKPTKIFVSHPLDTNKEHKSFYLFLQVALWDLEGKLDRPQVFPYIIHIVGWPKPRGYHPKLALDPPPKCSGIAWQKFSLSEKEIKVKHDIISSYRSEIPYNPPYLYTFARKNELFGDYPIITLKRQSGEEEAEWKGAEVCILGEKDDQADQEAPVNMISSLSYACKDDNLFMRLTLRKKIDRKLGISIYLLGYNKEKKFADMSKIRILLGFLGARIMDKKQPITIPGFKVDYEGKAVILKIPLLNLGSPDYILSSARAAGFPFEASAWRILQIE